MQRRGAVAGWGCLLALAVSAAPAAGPPAPPLYPKLTVVTDAAWKGAGTLHAGWESAGHPDHTWKPATVQPGPEQGGPHYAVKNQFALPSPAAWLWAGDGEECYLRRRFVAPKHVRRAEVLWLADDSAELYVNGALVEKYTSGQPAWGHRGAAALCDVLPYLVEGPNVLAVHVKNEMLWKGVALEMRINDAPFLPARVAEKPAALPAEVVRELDALAVQLDDDTFAVREAASERLLALAKKHGLALEPRLTAIHKAGSVEVRRRVSRVLTAFQHERELRSPKLDPAPGEDMRFFICSTSLRNMTAWWGGAVERRPPVMKQLLQCQALQASEEGQFEAALQRALRASANDHEARLVAFASLLEMKGCAADLAAIVQARPRTKAAALAASALGRLGDKGHVEVLEKATRCGYAPTERAAAHALVALKGGPR